MFEFMEKCKFNSVTVVSLDCNTNYPALQGKASIAAMRDHVSDKYQATVE